MATCKDCLGFEFCLDRLGTTKYYDNAIAANNVEELCQKFKNRKRFIEVIRCKDCIKADVCKVAEEFDKEPVDGIYIEGCEHFKNRNQFVEVIRCKDCKWLNKTKMICMNKNNRVFNTGKSVYSNNFCNYGEKEN